MIATAVEERAAGKKISHSQLRSLATLRRHPQICALFPGKCVARTSPVLENYFMKRYSGLMAPTIFSIRTLLLCACGVGAIIFSASPASAGLPAFPRIDFGNFPRRIPSRDAGEKLSPGTKVAMACKECKMLNVQTVDNQKRFLAWFVPQVKHDCPGCGGKMTLKSRGAAKEKNTQYTHVCSKCGNNSTYVCAERAKH